MTDDLARVDDIQLAADTAEGEGRPEEGDGAEAFAAGGGSPGKSQAQDVNEPPTLETAAGETDTEAEGTGATGTAMIWAY